MPLNISRRRFLAGSGTLIAGLRAYASKRPGKVPRNRGGKGDFFQVGKRGGRWLFLNPDGKPFFSIGINHIDSATGMRRMRRCRSRWSRPRRPILMSSASSILPRRRRSSRTWPFGVSDSICRCWSPIAVTRSSCPTAIPATTSAGIGRRSSFFTKILHV